MSRRNPVDVPCAEVVELVTAYLDDALPPEQAEEIRAHLDICRGCQAYIEQFKATIDALGTLPVDTLSERACADLIEAFRRLPRDR
jgi:anti-sigma factor RsiW